MVRSFFLNRAPRLGVTGCVMAVALALLTASAGSAQAQTLYGVTWDSKFYTINTTTGAGTLVGNLSTAMFPGGMAFRGNKLYVSDLSARRLREIDPATAATLNTIDVGILAAGEGDLAFRSDGIGFFAGFAPDFYRFDITVPNSTVIGTTHNIEALAFNTTDVLYAITEAPGAVGLHTINQTTGAGTLIGPTGVIGGLAGMSFHPSTGTLYAAIGPTIGPASLYTINTTTGSATLVGVIGFPISGIAFAAGGPPPPTPDNPPLPPGEGNYPGSSGPPGGGGEGGFGFGFGGMAPSRSPILHGPLADTAANHRVLNVSLPQGPQASPGADAGFGLLDWTLFSGLALATMAVLALKYSVFLGR